MTPPVCTDHHEPVPMRRLNQMRFLRAVAPDGRRGPRIDTGTGPHNGLWMCPSCNAMWPQVPPPDEPGRA